MRLISATSQSGVFMLHLCPCPTYARSRTADLIARLSRDAHFRTKFQASIVSIRREGHKMDSKLGDVALQAKDEILFDCGDDFDEASDIVQQNLYDIDLVETDTDREFMVAFEVLGPLLAHVTAAYALCITIVAVRGHE